MYLAQFLSPKYSYRQLCYQMDSNFEVLMKRDIVLGKIYIKNIVDIVVNSFEMMEKWKALGGDSNCKPGPSDEI